MLKTIVMANGQNINTESEINVITPTEFTEITDKDTGNIIVINVKQISYVINRA